MRIAIFSISASDPHSGAVLMARAAEEKGHIARIGTFQTAEEKAWLAQSDILILRTAYRTYPDVIEAAAFFERNNPRGIISTSLWGVEHSFDKYLAYQVMKKQGIQTPETYLIQSMEDVDKLDLAARLPLIVKPRTENQGRGVKVVRNPEELAGHAQELLYAYGTCIAQYFVEEAKGKDVRAFVVGDQVVASMERHAPEGSVIANLYRGGTATNISLDETSQKLAVAAAQAFEASFAGIDLLKTNNGMTVLEINISPGFTIAEITGVDVANRIIDHLITQKERATI